MKSWVARIALSGLLVMGLAVAASAETLTYKIDKSHTEIGFKIRHFFSKVAGRFTDFDGEIQFDPKDLTKSSVDVTIQASSIFTDNERRDNDLRSDSFFDVEKYPTLTFKSTKVIPGDDDAFQIEGDFTMHGVTKKVTLDAALLGQGSVAIGGRNMGTRAGFEASTKIDRKEFGITWNRVLDQGGTMLGDDVEIMISIEAVHMDKKPEASKS